MAAKQKMTKDIVPEGFSLGLALVDAIPVVFFGLSFLLLGLKLSSVIFSLGALLCLFAGAAKVIWKIIVVFKKKNVWWLFLQMRILMPIGFLLMLAGFLLKLPVIDGMAVWTVLVGLPQVVFFALGVLGMVLMMVFAFTLDSSDVKSNWIEQTTNGVAQVFIFIGILLCL